MIIAYSEHAKKRMKQRGITELEVEYILMFPRYIKKIRDRKEVLGNIKNRTIRIIILKKENYISIITVI
ncbi:DUF4258 domain-containing protein [Candidatus Woesearchaeota archaeon]|nr:DUF4258 domain-containing protein [Candidatus Woesearchaeota archaeon]